jgi:hypothetical protein
MVAGTNTAVVVGFPPPPFSSHIVVGSPPPPSPSGNCVGCPPPLPPPSVKERKRPVGGGWYATGMPETAFAAYCGPRGYRAACPARGSLRRARALPGVASPRKGLFLLSKFLLMNRSARTNCPASLRTDCPPPASLRRHYSLPGIDSQRLLDELRSLLPIRVHVSALVGRDG